MTHQPFVTHVKLSQHGRRCPWDLTATYSDGQVETLASFRYTFSGDAAQYAASSFAMMLAGATPEKAREVAADQVRELTHLMVWVQARVEQLHTRFIRH